MTFVGDNWKALLAVVVVAFFTIGVLKLDYNDLQTARDAATFREVLGDDRGRAIGATLADMVFAVGYGLLGLLVFRTLDKAARGLIGAALIGGGAIADEIENVLVLRNIVAAETTTDGWIDAMRTVGTAKLTLLYLALGALAGFAVLRVVRNRPYRAGS